MELLVSLSVVNPFTPQSMFERCRGGPMEKRGSLRHLCQLWGLNFSRVLTQLVAIRAEFAQDPSLQAAANENLLQCLNNHDHANPEFWKDKPDAMKYIECVFGLAVTSHYIEYVFSIMAWLTGGNKSNTNMKTFANMVYLKSTKAITADSTDGDSKVTFKLAVDGSAVFSK